MASDLRKYDYEALNSCINQMKQKGLEIEAQAEALQKQVMNLMGTWSGSTATSYNGMATDLKSELDRGNQNLELTRQALQTGMDHMSDTDLAGGKSFTA